MKRNVFIMLALVSIGIAEAGSVKRESKDSIMYLNLNGIERQHGVKIHDARQEFVEAIKASFYVAGDDKKEDDRKPENLSERAKAVYDALELHMHDRNRHEEGEVIETVNPSAILPSGGKMLLRTYALPAQKSE